MNTPIARIRRDRRRAAPVALLLASLAAAAGCAGIGGKMLDYATVDQGATLMVSGTDGGYAAVNLIDGITDVEAWTPDSGWQYSFERGSGYSRSGGSIEDNMSRGSGWVHITFPEPRRINRIAVHVLDTEEMPYPGFLNGLAQVHTPEDTFFPWKTVGQVEKGFIIIPGKQPVRARATTTFRFNQVTADAVRVVIYTMGDSHGIASDEPAQSQGFGGRGGFRGRARSGSTQETTVRLVEIEVTGSEAVKEPASTAAAD
ncbi:hypothetical protein CMK11_08050 [Candidatus Poribacteria bacterium]|nr:hypothetical protein [Candidatus Poribacteria bacterium]